MSVIWIKVWHDIWGRKGRTALVVLSIAAGVFAVGTIFGMVDQLLTNMDASHVASNPSHINVILRQPITAEIAESIEKLDGIAGVEPMNGAAARYRTDPSDPWTSTTLVMRDDYENQRFDNLTLVAGSWPSKNDIAIERTSQAYFGLDIGDKIYLDLETTDRQFEITGRVRHPFVPPPDFGGDTHFIVSNDVIARFGLPRGQFTQLLIQVENHSDEIARERMADIRDHLAKQNVGVAIAIFQEPEEHWGRPFMLGMTFVLRILAVLALLTSVILVINTMTAVITQQVDQIGIIKAIGGKSGIITRIYLAGVAVYGVLAMIVALPLGMGMAFGASQALLNIFNIDYNTFAFSNRAVLLQVGAALVAPLVAALFPVLRGARMSVREAIASYGLGGDFGSNRFDQWIERNSQKILSSPYAIAIGNMFRKKGRLLLTQAVLVLAGGLFILVLTLANSVTATLEHELARRDYDMRIVFAGGGKTGRYGGRNCEQVPDGCRGRRLVYGGGHRLKRWGTNER